MYNTTAETKLEFIGLRYGTKRSSPLHVFNKQQKKKFWVEIINVLFIYVLFEKSHNSQAKLPQTLRSSSFPLYHTKSSSYFW